MTVRAFALLIPPLLLAACHKAPSADPAAVADNAPKIPCALAGATEFRTDCTIEKIATPDGLTLVIHDPAGGFRKLTVATDGRGVITADGSETADVKVIDAGSIEVAIDKDRYRLPATVKGEKLPVR